MRLAVVAAFVLQEMPIANTCNQQDDALAADGQATGIWINDGRGATTAGCSPLRNLPDHTLCDG